MKTDIVTVPTVTLALKAKKILLRQGIKVNVVNISNTERNNGCAYGIEFDSSYYFSVISVLKDSEVPYKHYKKD